MMLFHKIVDNSYPNLALVAKYETWMDGTMVRLDEDDNIVNFVPKKLFNYNDIAYYYKTVNIISLIKFIASNYNPFLETYIYSIG